MLTSTVAGRTWSFSHAIGRVATDGNGFSQPTAVAVAPGGILYVLSRGQESGGFVAENRRIGKLTIDEEFLGDFGRGGELGWPAGLAVRGDGALYCSDEYRNVIGIYSPDGQRIGEWGEPGSDEGELDGPSGIAFDRDDNLYVVDSMNHRVQHFTSDGRVLASWGELGDAQGQFNQPWGITVDRAGDVYVADWRNSRVQKFAPDGTQLMTFGSTVPDGGELDHPAGVAVDSEGDVYVTDWGNRRVQIYDRSGDVITALWGDATELSKWGKIGLQANPDAVLAYRRVKDLTVLARFYRPVGIAIDRQDRIVVADASRHRLQVYVKEKDYLEPQYNL